MSAGEFVTGVGGMGDFVAGDLPGSLRRATIGLLALLAAAIVSVAPAAAAPLPNPALNSTDAMLRWINAYRGKPEPEALPVLVRALSERQAFKDAETSGAYIGFIAGVLGANPDHAAALVAKMLPIAPADHWVLVGAIAYSGLPDWKELLATFVDRMPTRRAMIDKYLDGKLPTLDQIAYQPAKPGMLDKIKRVLKIDNDRKKAVAIEPSPELIDVAVGQLPRHRLRSADRPHHQAVAAGQRQGQRRKSHHRQRRQVHARQQRRARPASARDPQARGQEPTRSGRRGAQRRDRDRGDRRHRAYAQRIARRDR